MNDLTFNQVSSVLNEVVSQATGVKSKAPVNSGEFTAVAQLGLKTGYDPVLGALGQTLGRTIFSTRPYYRKLGSLMVNEMRFGNQMRKVNIADRAWVDDDRMPLTDGASVDQQIISKPPIIQTNFYGMNVYERYTTVFKDQLDSAFSSADEFARFLSMVMTNASDQIEQAHESMARMCIANMIGGKISGDADNVIHLLTEYNTRTGLSLTKADIYKPENFKSFMQWVYARIETLSSLMTERTVKFHINLTGKDIARHTPFAKQKLYIFAGNRNETNATVLANTFNKDMLKMRDTELVNFWQSIDDLDSINVTPTYMKPDGTLETPSAPVEADSVLGILFDEEAMGYTSVNQWSMSSPFNARGGYSNIFWHFTDRYWNDFTENALVLLLD